MAFKALARSKDMRIIYGNRFDSFKLSVIFDTYIQPMNTPATPLTNGPSPLGRPSIEYAAILSMLAIFLMVITYYLNIDSNSLIVKLVNWALSIGGVFWFIWHYKTRVNGNQLSFGTGIKLSALTGLFTGLFTGASILIFMQWIATDYQDRILEASIAGMQRQGLSDDQIKTSMPMVELFTSPIVIAAMIFIGCLISYTLIGLVATAIMKKEQS